jgi:branched-subunit amino acid ABC-type transport system permease component
VLDTVLKIVALAGFAASLAVLAVWVPLPDLIAVVGIAVALALYDFFIRPLRQRNGSQP